LDLKSECILVGATLVHHQAWEIGAKCENNKRSPCLLAHFPFINTGVQQSTSLISSRCYVNY